MRGANPVTGLGLDGAVVCCVAYQSSHWSGAHHQSSNWIGDGWGIRMLRGANPVTGLRLDGAVVCCWVPIQFGLDGAVVCCLAPIQSLEWGWMRQLSAAWRQSSHWIGAGWAAFVGRGANPVTGLGLDEAVDCCVAPIQSLDWGWMGQLSAA